MIELKENSVKFLLMFMESNSDELEEAILENKKTNAMKIVVDNREDGFDFETFDFEHMSRKLRKHIPALSDTQLNNAIQMCKLKKDQIRSNSQLIQVIIDHL